jgi:hypothetical protein
MLDFSSDQRPAGESVTSLKIIGLLLPENLSLDALASRWTLMEDPTKSSVLVLKEFLLHSNLSLRYHHPFMS